MANIKHGERHIESPESSPAVERVEVTSLQQSDDGLSEVEGNVSNLMNPGKTLVFSPSLISHTLIKFHIGKGYFTKGECRPWNGEETPVLRLLFLGISFWLVFCLLSKNVKLHHLTPLLDFPFNTMHEMCCNMPYLVAIAAIATNFFRKKTHLYVSLH